MEKIMNSKSSTYKTSEIPHTVYGQVDFGNEKVYTTKPGVVKFKSDGFGRHLQIESAKSTTHSISNPFTKATFLCHANVYSTPSCTIAEMESFMGFCLENDADYVSCMGGLTFIHEN